MAEITKPIALDESFNTTEGSPRNVADVLAQGIGDLVTVVSRISHQTTYDELSDLEDVNISAPTNGDVLTYDGSKWTNGQVGGGSVEQMIAPVETSTTASQAYAIGEQFILNGTLYTATAAITAGGTITIDGNCTASDTVTEQISNGWKYLDTKTGTGDILLPALFNELLIYVKNRNNNSEVYTFNVAKNVLSSTEKIFRTGNYVSSTNNATAAISVNNANINLAMMSFNGNDYTSTSTIEAYYR